MVSAIEFFRFRSIAAFLLLLFSFCVQAAELPEGEKSILFVDNNGERLTIGKIDFKHKEGRVTYSIEFDDSVFSNEFLSMRPFKCIRKPGKMVCNLIYPYAKKGYITKQDMLDLEYDLLFLHKAPEEYGINAWNGLYYRISIINDGLEAKLMEVDLNVLAGPPDEGLLRPITDDMLHKADPALHMFPRLLIQ